jgi:hypothetical protein
MKHDELYRRLIAAARADAPSEQVPYSYAKRVMARLGDSPRTVVDAWGVWAGGLWRGAVPCVAVMLLLSAWAVLAPRANASSNDFSQELENTVLAAVDQEAVTDSTW